MQKLYLAISLLILAFAGCSSRIEGTVFLDENGNNTRDEGESGIGRVAYTITLDDKVVKSGLTKSEEKMMGAISESLTGKGYYCIELKKTTMSYLDPSTAPQFEEQTKGKKPKTGKSVEPAATATPANTGNTSGTASTTTSETPAETKDDKPKEPEQQAMTTSQKACKNSEGYGSLKLDVPVTKDYENSLAQYPESEIISPNIGESFNYNIVYPCSCKPLNFTLPSTVALAMNQAGSLSAMLDLSPLLSKAEILKLPSYDITNDKICKVTTQLMIVSGSGSEQVELSPKAICPNDSIIPLPSQIIKWKPAKVKFEQNIDYSGNLNEIWGKELILNTTVKNYRTNEQVGDSTATLTIKLPKYCAATKVDERCSNQIQSVSCSVQPGDETPYSVTFRFPAIDEINKFEEKLEFVIETSLQTPDSDDAIKAESIPLNPPFPKEAQ